MNRDFEQEAGREVLPRYDQGLLCPLLQAGGRSSTSVTRLLRMRRSSPLSRRRDSASPTSRSTASTSSSSIRATRNHCNASSSKRWPNVSLTPAAPSTFSASRQMKTRMRPCSVYIRLRDRRPDRHAHRKQPQLWSLLEELASRKRIAPQL